MKKGFLVLSVVVSLLIGVGIGVWGHWYFTDHMPKIRQQELAQKQQAELNKMVRSGDVVSVKPDELTVKVQHSGDPQFNGKTIAVKTDQYTSVQAGMSFVSKPGQSTDLSKYLKPGMQVDLLVKGNKAVAVHWNPPGQTGQGQKQ